MIKEFEIMKGTKKETYVYNYDEMSTLQILNASGHFDYAENMKDVIATSKDEKARIVRKTMGIDGYELLLMKKVDDMLLSNNDKVNHCKDLMQYFKGSQLSALEECKADFFQKRNIITAESRKLMKQFLTNKQGESSLSEVIKTVSEAVQSSGKK